METLGQRIKKCAESNGWGDEQIAEFLGISKRAANSYVHDDRKPTFENLVKLAARLGVSTDFLLTGAKPIDPLMDASEMTGGQRLARWRRAKGLTVEALASSLGASTDLIEQIEADQISVSPKLLDRLKVAYQVNPDWIAAGIGAVTADGHTPRAAERSILGAPMQDFVQVRMLKTQLSAGAGMAASDEVIGNLAFRTDWLRREGIAPGIASLVRVKGDNMEPTLLNGALVLVDHGHKDPTRKGIFALRIGDDVMVKRLHLQPGALLIQSDNPAYESRVLAGQDIAQVEVIGRVAWQGYTFRQE